jgi:cyclophilin family peptidyl-prolyl cis-trans isomerase
LSVNRRADVDKTLADVDFTKNDYQIELDTTMGKIRLALDPSVAPEHCKNMIGLTKLGHYDGVIFHRVIQGFMIQGGCPLGTGTGGPGYSLKAEFNATPHEAGVVSMARANDPNSAGSQFFVCLDRVPHLDRHYTAFGRTANAESLAIVQKIGAVKTGSNDRPVQNVTITEARVLVMGKG